MHILPGVVGTRSVLKGTSELRAAAAAAINSRGAFFSPITSTLQKEIFHPATTVIFQEPKEGR